MANLELVPLRKLWENSIRCVYPEATTGTLCSMALTYLREQCVTTSEKKLYPHPDGLFPFTKEGFMPLIDYYRSLLNTGSLLSR